MPCENGSDPKRCICHLVGHHYIRRDGVWTCLHCDDVNNEVTSVFPKEHTNR